MPSARRYTILDTADFTVRGVLEQIVAPEPTQPDLPQGQGQIPQDVEQLAALSSANGPIVKA